MLLPIEDQRALPLDDVLHQEYREFVPFYLVVGLTVLQPSEEYIHRNMRRISPFGEGKIPAVEYLLGKLYEGFGHTLNFGQDYPCQTIIGHSTRIWNPV